MILTFTLGLLSAQLIQFPQSMDLALHGLPTAQQLGEGSLHAAAACADFNRADGSMGAHWTEVVDGDADCWELNNGYGSPGAFTLAKTGACPGPVTLSTFNGTPLGTVRFTYAFSPGTYTWTGTPCTNLVLGLNNPTLYPTPFTNDSFGATSVSFNAMASFCGRNIQAVDIGTCATSNIVVL